MGPFPTVEVPLAVGVADVLRVGQRQGRRQHPALRGQPARAGLEPDGPAPGGVVGQVDEGQRILRIELERRRDLLLLAAQREDAEVGRQPALVPHALQPRLEAPQVLGLELGTIRGNRRADVEAAGLESA